VLLPFATGSRDGKSLAVDTERLVNCYVETSQSRNSKAVKAIHGRPGLDRLGNYGTSPCRGAHSLGAFIYAVFRDELLEIRNDGVSTAVGTLNTVEGLVSMADNGSQLLIVDGQAGYIWSSDPDLVPVPNTPVSIEVPTLSFHLLVIPPTVGDPVGQQVDLHPPTLFFKLQLYEPSVNATLGLVFGQVSDLDFPPNPAHVTYLDGFFIVQALGDDKFYVSSLKDGTTWSALDFATAESDPDNLLNVIGDHGELWLLGSQSTEVWRATGNRDFVFERLEGAKIQWGIHAAWSLAQYSGSLVCLGVDGDGTIQVMSFSNYQAVRISNDALEAQIAKMPSSSDAIGYVYADRGRMFYVLTFPAGNQTWAFDVREAEWHELRTGNGDRFVPQHHIFHALRHIVTDHTTGDLHVMGHTTHADNGTEILVQARGAHLEDNERLVGHAALQIVFEHGTGLAVGQGQDPQAMLRWSSDAGNTWSSEHWRAIGKIGEHKNRCIWRTLGRARDRVYEVSVTDPVKRTIVGMVLTTT